MCCPHCCTQNANADPVNADPTTQTREEIARTWWSRPASWVGVGVGTVIFVAILAATLPALFGWNSVKVLGSSMGSELPVGSVAVTRKVAADQIRTGQVILFSSARGGVPTLHRVIRFENLDGKRVAITKGDANASEDTTPVVLDKSGSVVQYHIPFLGYLFAAMANHAKILLFLCAPLALLLLMLLPETEDTSSTPTAASLARSDSFT